MRDDAPNTHHITTENAEAPADRNVWTATINEATKYYREWSYAYLYTEFREGKIMAYIIDDENNDICDVELTSKIYVPAIWESAACNGKDLTIHVDENGKHFVYADILPDGGYVEIVDTTPSI